MQYSQTRYEDTLEAGISADELSFSVNTAAPTRTEGIITLGRKQDNTEDVYFNNVAGNTVTVSLRGLSTTALTLTSVAGNKKVHEENESVEITTHHNYDTDKARKSEDETITGRYTFLDGFKTDVIYDSNNNEALESSATPSAVNHPELVNSATGNNVIIRPKGSDTNINLELQGKGSGVAVIPDGSETKTNAAPTSDKQVANKKYVDDTFTGVTDVSVKVSNNDTTAGKLNDKIAVQDGFSKSISSPSGNESLLIEKTVTAFAYAALTAGNHVALCPIDVEWSDVFTDLVVTPGLNQSLGDANARRRIAIKKVAAKDVTITNRKYRMKKVSSATQTITFSLQADNSGAPSGTALASTTLAASSLSTSYATITATYSGSVAVTKGTTYWEVIEVNATDATNYVQIAYCSTSTTDALASNFLPSGIAIYDLDTATWSASATRTIFSWGSENFGYALVKADADLPLRAWNYLGVVKANASQGDDADVYYDVVPASLISATPNADYYISSTAGSLTTTAPNDNFDESNNYLATVSWKVARGLPDGSLLIEKDQKTVNIIETSVTATGTYYYPVFFNIKEVIVNALGSGGAISLGQIIPNGQKQRLTLSVANALDGNTDYSLQIVDGGNNMVGQGTLYQPFGFGYTITETGTVSIAVSMKVIGV